MEAAICAPGFTSYSARALRIARTRSMIRPISLSAASSRGVDLGQDATIRPAGQSLASFASFRYPQVSSVTKGMNGCSSRSDSSSTLMSVARVSAFAVTFPRYSAILLISRYQSQNSLQKKS